MWVDIVAKNTIQITREYLDSQIKTSLVFDSLNTFDEPYSDPSTIPTYN